MLHCDEAPGVVQPKATRARNANNAQYRCLRNVRLCANEDWDCSPSKHKKSTCIITSRTNKRVKLYSVPKRRALKAMKLMSPSNIQEVVDAKYSQRPLCPLVRQAANYRQGCSFAHYVEACSLAPQLQRLKHHNHAVEEMRPKGYAQGFLLSRAGER